MKGHNLILNSGQKLFHTKDFAVLWGIENKNTLYTTLKRYTAAGKIYRIQKGLYSIVSPDKINPVLIARKLIPNYCYLSLDTVLFNSGYRSQKPNHFTFVGKESLSCSWKDLRVKCHQVKDDFLYNDLETYLEDGVRKATELRAICDTLYLNPTAHFDREINLSVVDELKNQIGYP